MNDIFRYSSMEDHLEILEWTLRVRHISPTAPDTLGNSIVTLVGSVGQDSFLRLHCLAQACLRRSLFWKLLWTLNLSLATAPQCSRPWEYIGHLGFAWHNP